MTSLVTLDDVLDARELLAGLARITPLEYSRHISLAVGGSTWLKCENLQRAGTYKVRGAYVRIARLSAVERARGVVAASAGNHAQGVALAASTLGTTSTVFMPTTAPLPKISATKGYGATVELVGTNVEEALIAAQDFAERTGAVFIHPFDHPDVIAGQATVALEIFDQCPEVQTIIAGIGGGGLISGIAVVAKALRSDVQVIGVQARGAAAIPPSLIAGYPVRLSECNTIADGIRVSRPGELTFQHIAKLVDKVITVSDEDISRALLVLLERHKLLTEPAGAVSVAGLMDGGATFDGPTVAVLSGGNIDPLLLLRVIEHGLAAAGRYRHFTVQCPDQPGQLANLLRLIANIGVNVLDVVHERYDPRLALGQVTVSFSVETLGPEHFERMVAALRVSPFTLTTNEN
ncbi:MAG: threonine ammonia-lyase [Longispora sp.]|nr:threonine ammonia-lyase [Longispora sp. (in: high G+C Gram-positive bacteria)]